MKHRGPAVLSALGLVVVVLVTSLGAANPGVTFIGIGLVPGNALDKSGLAGQQICQFGVTPANCIDQATFGGFGSALAYTGFANLFLAVPDRGPFDGRTDVPYRDRAHYIHLAVDTSAPPNIHLPNIHTTLLDTVFLKERHNHDLVGSVFDFDARFDPEGAVFSHRGTFFVSDEYGPDILEFTLWGRLVRRIKVPAKFLIANPSSAVYPFDGTTSFELDPSQNASGRQANRGMEGLTISPDGRYLFGLMQNALIQDNGLNYDPLALTPPEPPGRRGLNTRLLKVDLKTGATWEYVYVVDAIGNGRGLNDLLAINDHEFLVVERDNRSRVPTPPNQVQTPNNKRIYRIDLTGATDVSNKPSLPVTGAELALMTPPIVPVTKGPFIDLLDSSYVVDTPPAPALPTTIRDVIAEKIEGTGVGTRSAGWPSRAVRNQRQRLVCRGRDASQREAHADLRVCDRPCSCQHQPGAAEALSILRLGLVRRRSKPENFAGRAALPGRRIPFCVTNTGSSPSMIRARAGGAKSGVGFSRLMSSQAPKHRWSARSAA